RPLLSDVSRTVAGGLRGTWMRAQELQPGLGRGRGARVPRAPSLESRDRERGAGESEHSHAEQRGGNEQFDEREARTATSAEHGQEDRASADRSISGSAQA